MDKKIDLEKNDKITVLQKYKAKKYFILHDQQSETHLYNVILDEFDKKIKAQTSDIGVLHTFYKPIPGEISHKYKKKLGDPKSEIHLYTSSPIYADAKNFVDIPLDKIDSIIVYKNDTGHEVLKVVGITAGTLVVVTAIIALTKSSCPFVYSNDGTIFYFEGELYPGAIRPTMERNDFFKLKHLKEKNNLYTIKVSNELKEIQYTNHLNLLEVLHPEDSEAMIDQNGKIHTVKNPISPFEISAENQLSDPKIVANSDNNSIHFNATSDNSEFQTLKLKFNRPQEKAKVKLILRLKNSYWLDYTFGKFYKKFGSSFNEFQKKNRNQPYEKSLKWMKEQGIPLEILIKNNEEWTLVESLNMVGPLAFRDIVVPIDLKSNSSKPLEIMLRCGFMFWEVDKIAADFSENSSVIVNNLQPFRAIDQNGNDVLKSLTQKDNQYLVQPNIGDHVYVSFKSNPEEIKEGKKTVFLENSGYYEYIRNFSGNANKLELMTFRNPGTFAKFSEKMYYEFISGEKALEELAIFDVAK